MIDGLANNGAMGVLERLVQFTSARHRVLVDDIANLSTPYFQPRDLDVKSFQQALRQAIDTRRASGDPMGTPLQMTDTAQLRFGTAGLEAQPQASNSNVLFHDENNRDLERLMQHLAENTLTHRAGLELWRSEVATLQTAIRERV